MAKHTSKLIVTKYQNETNDFINRLTYKIGPKTSYQELSRKLEITYMTLFNSFKRNRISFRLSEKIKSNFELTQEENLILMRLMLDEKSR